MSVEPLSETTSACCSQQHEPALSARGNDVDWALEHAELLQRLIRRRTRPLDCVDEVFQEVLLAASQSPNVPEEPEQRVPWLVKVAVRQSAMALRTWGRRQRRETVYAETQAKTVERRANDPIFALLADERRDLLRSELRRLPEEHQQLLVMKYVGGLTYREIARRTGMDLNAVEYQLAKARQGLRRRLVHTGIEEGRGDD